MRCEDPDGEIKGDINGSGGFESRANKAGNDRLGLGRGLPNDISLR